MSTPTLMLAIVAVSAMVIASEMPVLLLSWMGLCGVDARRSACGGGTTTSPSRLRNDTTAPAADIWSMLRFDDVPFHHLLPGTVLSAKRAPVSANRSPASPYCP